MTRVFKVDISAPSIIKDGGTSSQYLMADGSVSTGTSGPLTQTALSSGFSIAGGTTSKTLQINNTITLAGTDSTTMTFPAISGTVATLNTTNTFTTNQIITPGTSVTALTINGAASSIGLIVKANATTPGNLQEWQNSAGTALAKVDSSGNLTASSIIKSGGTSSQYLMADGSVNTNLTSEVTPLDDISNYFDGTTNRFVPRYQGQQVTISNPFRLLLSINGIIQTVRNAEYVWQSMIAQNGVRVDNDGYIVFPEAVPAGSQFDARLMAGSTTTSITTAYPFRAMDIILGG